MSWGIAAQPDMNTTDMNVKTADNRFIIVSPSQVSYDSTNGYQT
jgi:hypothetical protein